MLNEVWQLVRSLDTIAATVTRKNPRVKEPESISRGTPALRIRLAPTGEVAAVEEITDDEWVGVWTIREGNANSFPIVRPSEPLVPIVQSDPFWENRIDLTAITERWGVDRSKAPQPNWMGLIAKADELRHATGSSSAPCVEVQQIADRFSKAAGDPLILLSKIADLALAACQDGRLSATTGTPIAAGLLVGEWKQEKGRWKQKSKIQLLFDITGDSSSSTIYREQVRRHVVEVLPVHKNKTTTTRTTKGKPAEIACSLSGEHGARLTAKFPKVALPVFKQEFALFAKFKDADCHQRYGLIESASMPVVQSSARRLQEALSYIVAPNREDCTWRPVASGHFQKLPNGNKIELRDLLIVYPEAKPDIDARVAELFGTNEDTAERQFDADTNTVCKALDGIATGQPRSKLQLFIIRKLDKARSMVVVSESPTVPEVIAAARRWSEAAANVPQVVIPLPPKEKKQPPIEGRPQTPYPDQVVRLLSEQWARQGKQATKVPGVGLGDVLQLMLHVPGKWEASRDRMLDLFVARLSPLVIGVGGQLGRSWLDKKPWDGCPAKSRQTALRAVSVAGILLHAYNRQREVYMTSSAFSIGQFLKLSDTLHKDYCIVVRNGSLPPSLIGNAMMPTAVDNPRRAVADLNDRMRVYTGWAKTAREPKNAADNDPALIAVREARKTLRRFEPLVETLVAAGLPDRCDNVMKAEMLLGYLAKVQDFQPVDKESNRE